MFTTLAFLLYRLASLTVLFAQEASASDFEDLGSLLLVGGLSAIAVGIIVTIVRLKIEGKKEPREQFISIKPPKE